MELFNQAWVQMVLEVVLSVVAGWCLAKVQSLEKEVKNQKEREASRTKALELGVSVLLQSKIVDAYEDYVVKKHPLSIERKREIDQAYMAYRALDGDGTVTTMYTAFCQIPVTLVDDDYPHSVNL